MSTSKKLLFSGLSAMLLALGWPHVGQLYPLLFIALVPYMVVERTVSEEWKNGEKGRLFPYTLTMLIGFNALTTWWVWNASAFGAIMAISLNSLFLASVIQMAHFARKSLGNFRGNIAFLFCWIGWEYFHQDWDLSWTWLTLGNGLAQAPYLIQWYEITGVLGGTFWVLASNILWTNWLFTLKRNQLSWRSVVAALLLIRPLLIILLPAGISLYMFINYSPASPELEVVAVQPNSDPYHTKFSKSSTLQVQDMLALAAPKVSPKTQWVIFPETAIPDAFNEDDFYRTPEASLLAAFLTQHPQTDIIIGASTYVVYPNDTVLPATARTAQDGTKYDYCNTAIHVRRDGPPQFYHKAKMVPGVEKMPFPGFFNHLQALAFDLGGTVGSLGGVTTPRVFYKNKVGVAPVICYESVYGEFVSEFVNKGAQAIFIITNDGWWGDTPGYQQHHTYAQLRAIETRRYVVRSANTGITSVINDKGETIQQTQWWEPIAINAKIGLNTHLTFYTRYGDILGRTSLGFGVLLLFMALSRRLINKDNAV